MATRIEYAIMTFMSDAHQLSGRARAIAQIRSQSACSHLQG